MRSLLTTSASCEKKFVASAWLWAIITKLTSYVVRLNGSFPVAEGKRLTSSASFAPTETGNFKITQVRIYRTDKFLFRLVRRAWRERKPGEKKWPREILKARSRRVFRFPLPYLIEPYSWSRREPENEVNFFSRISFASRARTTD